MNKLFIAFALLFSVLLSAQKVKVKKGKITIDKIEVGKVKDPYRNHYDFYDLQDNKLFSVDFDGITQDDTTWYQWLTIKNADESQTAEIEYDVLITSFSVPRIISHLLTVKYNVFDKSGFQSEAFEAMMAKNTEKLSEKYAAIVAEAKQKETQRNAKISGIESRYNPKVNSDGSITYYYPKKIMGRVRKFNCDMLSTQPCLQFFDLDGNLIATVANTKGVGNYKVTTIDNASFTYSPERSFIYNDDLFANKLLPELMARDYMFGHSYRQEQADLHRAKVVDAMDRSVNLYGSPGYVIDEDGKKMSGDIFIAFQMLDVNNTGKVLPENMPDEYGNTVYLKYLNEKGRPRTKKFKARNGVRFCVTLDGEEYCYVGMKAKGEALKKLQNMDGFKFDNSYFYQELLTYDVIQLLVDPVETEKFVVKLASEKKGRMLDNRSNEKLAPVLAEYLSKCKDLSKEIKEEAFDLKLEENLRTIVDEYAECVK